MHYTFLLLLYYLFISPVCARLYTIYNNCPQNVNLFINGSKQGSLGVHSTTTRTLPHDWSGVIYSDINGGSPSGSKTTRAGFNGKDDFYYIIVESRLNTGITIEPQALEKNGFCVRDMCDNKACTSVYHTAPSSFPSPSSTPPTLPIYSCPGATIGYSITFCPSGGFPPPRNSEPIPIHPIGDKSKCLDVRGGAATNGSFVEIKECDNSDAQKWLISSALTQVSNFGNNLCLDAGKIPGSGARLMAQQCTFVVPDSQSWYYTEDKRLQLYQTDQCLELNGNYLRTSNCNGDTSQNWVFP